MINITTIKNIIFINDGNHLFVIIVVNEDLFIVHLDIILGIVHSSIWESISL